MGDTDTVRTEPYPGPKAFSEIDETFFFGRERETDDLFNLLSAHRIGLLYAASGAGKTSLINAGLKPRFERQNAKVRVLRVGVEPPRSFSKDPITNIFIANAIRSAFPNSEQRSSTNLSAIVEPESAQMQVLIFDQFEEIVTRFSERWKDRDELFRQAGALLMNPSVHLLFCLREEYLAAVSAYEYLLRDGFRLRYHLERLSGAQALLAIETPAQTAGCPFEDNVARQLLKDLQQERVQTERGLKTVVGAFVEPLQLQVVCTQIWRTLPADARTIKDEHVKRFGNASSALGDYYDATLRRIAASGMASEERLRAWFERELITGGGTRGIVYRGSRFTGSIRNEIVGRLESSHIIRGEARAAGKWYELTHDRFIDPIIESNRAWRRKKGIRSNVLSAVGMPMSIIVLIAAICILLYSLFALWPVRIQSAPPHIFGFALPGAFEKRLLWMVAIAGALGSFINAVGRFVQYFATRGITASWVWLYFARVPLDAGLAVVCYCLLRAAVAPSLSGTETFNSFGICGFAALVGLFGARLNEKLRDVADDLFRTAPGTGDAARRDHLSRPRPAIFETSPAELYATQERLWITLRGTTLVPGTTALIGEDARQTAYIDHTELRVLLKAGDASKAGPILIRAELPPPERTQSNTIALPVIPVSEYKG